MKTLMVISLLCVSSLVFAQDAQLEKACASGDGLACAKVAYSYRRNGDNLKAYEFYEKGCELNNETACYNKNNVNPRNLYFDKMNSLVKFHSSNLVNCYTPESRKIYSNTQLKEKWYTADYTIHVNKEGKADVVKVKTALSEVFIRCSQKVIKSIQFPKPEGIDPIFDYNLTIASQE